MQSSLAALGQAMRHLHQLVMLLIRQVIGGCRQRCGFRLALSHGQWTGLLLLLLSGQVLDGGRTCMRVQQGLERSLRSLQEIQLPLIRLLLDGNWWRQQGHAQGHLQQGALLLILPGRQERQFRSGHYGVRHPLRCLQKSELVLI